MNIEFDAYKVKLNEVKPALDDLAGSLNIEAARHELERLTAMQEAPGFWDNPEKSQQVVMKAKTTENKIKRYEQISKEMEDDRSGDWSALEQIFLEVLQGGML